MAFLAVLDKRAIREAVSVRVGDWLPYTTSGAGNGGGTTVVVSALIGRAFDGIINRYILLTSGTNDAQWRVATAFDATTGTITVDRAYTAQVASGVTLELHTFRPDILSTQAPNAALQDLYPAISKPYLHHAFPWESGDAVYGTPRGMKRITRVLTCVASSQRLADHFDRANSTTTAGGDWTTTNGQGTWGVSSERLYSVTDVDADLLLAQSNPQVRDGVLQAIVRGDTTASHFRVFSLLFRVREGYDGTPDTTNCLLVRVLNGQVDLRKRDGGTETSLTTATVTTTEDVDYLVRVMFQGNRIRVWLDDVLVTDYALVGLNAKYAQYGHAGIRLDLTGSPSLAATATRLDDYRLHELVGTLELTDWQPAADGEGLQLSARGTGGGAVAGRMLWIEGIGPLTQLAADTTFGTITADSTDVVELDADAPEVDAFYDAVKFALYLHASQPGNTLDPEDRRMAAEALPAAASRAAASRERRMQRRPTPHFRHP